MLLKDEVVFVFLIPNIITEENPNMDFWSFQKIDHFNVPVGRSNNPKLAALLFEINGNGKKCIHYATSELPCQQEGEV